MFGDTIQVGEQVGIEGTTGESTGIHLHVEMQDLTNHDWEFQADKDVYINPADFMGFPNEEGITVYYDGIPVTPDVTLKKQKFNWVLYAKKLRNKNNKRY